MKKEISKEQIADVLTKIQASVPKEWRDKLFYTEKKTPTIEFVMNEVIEKGLVPPEKIEQLKTLRDTGEFSKTIQKTDPRYEKMIDDYVTRKIAQAIKKGQLPPKTKKK